MREWFSKFKKITYGRFSDTLKGPCYPLRSVLPLLQLNHCLSWLSYNGQASQIGSTSDLGVVSALVLVTSFVMVKEVPWTFDVGCGTSSC